MKIKVEFFRPIYIKGKETNYLVSDYGIVINKLTRKKMKPFLAGPPPGYHYVLLSIDGKKYSRSIHRLVANAFLENPNDLPVVNHKNGEGTNRYNNRVTNLEWSTYSYNNLHAYNTSLNIHKGELSHFNKYPETLIKDICNELMKLNTIQEVVQKFNVNKQLIVNIYNKTIWRHITVNYDFPNKFHPSKNCSVQIRYTIYNLLKQDINLKPSEVIKILNLENIRPIIDVIRYMKEKVKKENT